jgi:hypothetical protein
MISFDVMLSKVTIRQYEDRGSGTVGYLLTDGEILVANQSYRKQVGFRVLVDGVWRDFYTLYARSLLTGGGNLVEAWTLKEYGELLKAFPIPQNIPPRPAFRLAVFYHNLDGNTWSWDNNNGNDYYV